MSQLERIAEIMATYGKHGWRLERLLVCPQTLMELRASDQELVKDAAVKEASVDALWFSRPSHAEREAWELRLVSDTQYALFETFEKDELEEDREEVRREIEARLIEHATRS
ncbi:MAG: hypothetical protein QOJ64_1074 [Acidobacteriota bacterium]|jgi:hypothetical protein|nr:hypothetical protein [Acidobacteriota bacterium]